MGIRLVKCHSVGFALLRGESAGSKFVIFTTFEFKIPGGITIDEFVAQGSMVR